jgi:hypothetical protein
MVAHRHDPHLGSPCPGPLDDACVCTRCGRETRRMYGFHVDVTARNVVLCGDCKVDWDDLQEDVAGRWLRGLMVCFFCRRPLGDERFPAESPFGTSCAKCGVTLAAMVSD